MAAVFRRLGRWQGVLEVRVWRAVNADAPALTEPSPDAEPLLLRSVGVRLSGAEKRKGGRQCPSPALAELPRPPG